MPAVLRWSRSAAGIRHDGLDDQRCKPKLLIFDELFAAAPRATGVPLRGCSSAGYVATMAALLWRADRGLTIAHYASGWTVAALVVRGYVCVIHHPKTGAIRCRRREFFIRGCWRLLIGVHSRWPRSDAAAKRRSRWASSPDAGRVHPTHAIFCGVVGVALMVRQAAALRRPLGIAGGSSVWRSTARSCWRPA